MCTTCALQGVIAAAALKCMGGSIQGRLWARDEADAAAIRASGRDTHTILHTDDLVKGSDVSGTSPDSVHCIALHCIAHGNKNRASACYR